MAVYYPLFAEPFDIASEPPLHTAIIRQLIEIFVQLISLNQPSAQSVNVVTKTSHEANENHFADTVTKDNFVRQLDSTLESVLRTARNIEQTKKTKVGIVYYDLIFRSQQSAVDVTFQYFLRDVIEEQFPNKTEAANFFGVHKSNMSRETLPYSNLIPWFHEIGYRVGHIESLYSDPDATKPTGNPLVRDHIKDLTTRELQLIKIGSALGAIATTSPATSLSSSKLKLQAMALTCANLLSEIVPVPEMPLNYHNSFFRMVDNIVKASCQAPTTSSSVGNLPDCRYLLRLEDPIPQEAKYKSQEDHISAIIKEWPLIMTDQAIETRWEELLKEKLSSMQQSHTSTDDRSQAKSQLVKNQHAMISRAFAELQYLSVFLELVDQQENPAEAASGLMLLDAAIREMEKHLTNMRGQLNDAYGTRFLLEDLGFHEVIPRLVANYREGEFNPLDIDLYTQMLHASALNRTHSRFKDRDDRSIIIQDHQDILTALKEYRLSVTNGFLKEPRPYAIVRIVESLSRHLYLALKRETDPSNQDISNVSHRSVSETIKLFSLTARSIIHQATALWTELGAKRMLFVSDYQLPREMLGGDASDDREKESNMLRFVIALAHLHERAEQQKSTIPFICVVGRNKKECEELFPVKNSVFLQQAESYYKGLPGNPAKYDLDDAFRKVKAIYFEIITKFDQNQRNSGSEKPTWTEQDLHTIGKLKKPEFFHKVMTRVIVHTERSKLRSYHVPGGAVAWILGADNQIFRTSRLSQEGNIIQDIWSGDEYLIELAEICDSLSQNDLQPNNASKQQAGSNRKKKSSKTAASNKQSSQGGLVGLGDIVSRIFDCSSRDNFSYFVEFVNNSRPHSSVSR